MIEAVVTLPAGAGKVPDVYAVSGGSRLHFGVVSGGATTKVSGAVFAMDLDFLDRLIGVFGGSRDVFRDRGRGRRSRGGSGRRSDGDVGGLAFGAPQRRVRGIARVAAGGSLALAGNLASVGQDGVGVLVVFLAEGSQRDFGHCIYIQREIE